MLPMADLFQRTCEGSATWPNPKRLDATISYLHFACMCFVCMYVSVYMCLHIVSALRLYVCMYMYVSVYMCLHIVSALRLYVFMYVHVGVHLYVCVCTCMHLCVCTCMHACVCTCMHHISGPKTFVRFHIVSALRLYVFIYVCMYLCIRVYIKYLHTGSMRLCMCPCLCVSLRTYWSICMRGVCVRMYMYARGAPDKGNQNICA
jgi:hypothetical protein